MTGNNHSSIGKIGKYAAVLLGGVIIVLAVWFGTGNYAPKLPEEITSSETTTKTEATTVTTTPEPTEATVSDADALNVDKLIDRYYSAKLNNDVEELNNIVEGETEYNEENLINETQFIEKIDDFKTLVLPGLTDNYFIVYVKYNIYFNGISVGAPSLNRFVVAKEDEEHYYIYDGSVSGEFDSYLLVTEGSETVLELRQQVEDELNEACAKNEDLNYLIQLLNSAVPAPSEAAPAETEATEATEEVTEAPAENTEEVTEAAPETAAEGSTEAAAE